MSTYFEKFGELGNVVKFPVSFLGDNDELGLLGPHLFELLL